MDKDALNYFEEILMEDCYSLQKATNPVAEIPDDEYKRALNVKIEAIKADIVNIQHLLET